METEASTTIKQWAQTFNIQNIQFKLLQHIYELLYYKNSSEDEIANVNVLRRHRTCRGQSLRPLNWVANFYYNYASMVIHAPNHLCTYAHHTELSEFVLPK